MNMSKPQTDLFGNDLTDAPDLTSDGLQWEADDTFDDMGDGEPLPSDEENDNTNADEPDEKVADDEADKADEDPAPATDTDNELPEAFRGKTAAELVQIIQASQSHIGQQGNEIGQLRQAVEAIQAAQAAAPAPQIAPASEYIQDENDGLIAYHEAIAMFERNEIPQQAIDEIIDVVRDLNPVIASRMDRDLGMRMATRQVNQQMQPVIQQSYDMALQQATHQVNQDPDAGAYREDIVRIVQQPANLVEHQIAVAYQQARTAPDIHAALAAALQIARGANPVKSTQYQTQIQATKQNEQVEGGNSTTMEEPATEEDRIRASLLNPHKSADMFAGFGAS